MINFFCIDNIEFMKGKPDKYYDLAIVDPPYGINIDNNKSGNFVMTKHKSKNWDNNIPTPEYFEQLFRVSKNQIIWGGNYFDLERKKGWICWDKINPMTGKFSDFELAWTSFLNCDRIYHQAWIGFGRKFKEKKNSIHPTQKPINLYRWILLEFASKKMKILDTHGGSFSHAIAADMEGFDLDIMDADKEYFDNGIANYKEYKRQMNLFQNTKAGSAGQKINYGQSAINFD
ncbi:MAG: hypothetical protein ACFFD1_00750 [Candidatus Thorarchaeota archaeon]